MDNRDILITNKTLIHPKHQCEHEPYEYFKYEATPRNDGGDIIVCSPSEKGAHRIVNSSGTENLVYIDFDTVNFSEVVFYPRSDKVGITENGQSNLFFRRNSNVGYYDGE